MSDSPAAGGLAMDGDAFFGSVNMAHRFTVAIDHSRYQLGTWATASGLHVTWQVVEYRAGDRWNQPFVFPGVPRYEHIKLTRAACRESRTVQEWLSETSRRSVPLTGAIALTNWEGRPTVTWQLKEFFPAAWSIDGFDSARGGVAMETLELAHSGFLDDDFAPAGPGPASASPSFPTSPASPASPTSPSAY